ncbi:MAG TPA: hypothetical protein VK133_01335 [Amoebophilaceae bacterium]|jgi:hypothetical protein|nr:hypothetical protein [Amoebophilaceae bacterium]
MVVSTAVLFLVMRSLFLFRRFIVSCSLPMVSMCMGVGWISCQSTKEEQAEVWHPIWFALNADEKLIHHNQCIITKMGWEAIRFHPADTQECLTPAAFQSNRAHLQEANHTATYLVFTPSFYGALTKAHFPRTLQQGIQYKHGGKVGGLPESFLEELLALEDVPEATVILATGMEGRLGISSALEAALKKKKEAGAIQDYKLLKSIAAVTYHNQLVKEGKKVYTCIHTAG